MELGVDEERLTGMLRGSDGRRVFEREGLGEERGVRVKRYFVGPPKQASTTARSLSGESSERSKSRTASFPSVLPARDIAAEDWAAEIGSTGCVTMFPWECA